MYPPINDSSIETMEARSGVRSRRIKSRNEKDRISDLPDSIIQHILSFLPTTRDAVRTGILSKRWRSLWAHLPVLIFNCSRTSGKKYLRFIENILILHECPKIKKFHLEYGYRVVKDPQFTAKIRFAIRKCVEELILIFHRPEMSILLPISLFDTASLVRLEMVNGCFKPNWRANLPSLKSLKLSFDGPDNNCSEGIENIVSGSPLLKCFEFRGYMLDGVAIFSKSLKVLTFIDVEVPASVTLKISCPNLVEFNVASEYWENYCYSDIMIENILLGCPIIQSLKIAHCFGFNKLVIASKSLKVLRLQSLQGARIEISCPNLEKLDILLSDIEDVKVVNPPSSVCVTLDIQECDGDDLFKELLEQFQHVNKIIMEWVFLKIVSELYAEDHQLPQLNYKCLTVSVGDFLFAIPGIMYALHSPRLESFVIKFTSKSKEYMSDGELQDLMISRSNYWNTHWSSGLSCLVSHLKTVEIIGLHETDYNCKFELEFIEFLLKSAQELKKMTVSLQKCRKDFVIEFSQKLVSFPRYSRFANVELLCST